MTYAAGTAKYTEGAEKTFVCNMKYGGQPMMVTTGARKLQMVQKAHTYAFLSLLVSLLFFFFLQGSKYRCMCFFRCFYAALIAERSCYMFVVPYRQTESEGWETRAVVLCQKRKL